RQNVFTDPQKPMKVEPGIYALNGADENSLCLTTVDFALTYFVVSGELERSRSEEHTSELQSRFDLVCRLLLEKKNIGMLEYDYLTDGLTKGATAFLVS